MKMITGNTVELTTTEIDTLAYFERLGSEGRSIAVAAFWALRMAAHLGQNLTTEFAMWLSDQTLVLDGDRLPVVNRFCPHGEDTVREWLEVDPRIAGVIGRRLMFVATWTD